MCFARLLVSVRIIIGHSQAPSARLTTTISVGAMTIPSALTLLVGIFPEPHEQAQAIGAFGGSGGVGNGTLSGPWVYFTYQLTFHSVLGLLIGAIFVKLAS